MAPFYDTDVAKERWGKDEWRNFELWEKVELRARKKRRLWILGTCIVFLLLSSIPILMDRWSKWETLSAIRSLAEEVNRIKSDAAIQHTAFRLAFKNKDSLDYLVKRVASCKRGGGVTVRKGTLHKEGRRNKLQLISEADGKALALPGLVLEFCFDSLTGFVTPHVGQDQAFGLIPVKDLTDRNLDHLSLLILRGNTANILFN